MGMERPLWEERRKSTIPPDSSKGFVFLQGEGRYNVIRGQEARH